VNCEQLAHCQLIEQTWISEMPLRCLSLVRNLTITITIAVSVFTSDMNSGHHVLYCVSSWHANGLVLMSSADKEDMDTGVSEELPLNLSLPPALRSSSQMSSDVNSRRRIFPAGLYKLLS